MNDDEDHSDQHRIDRDNDAGESGGQDDAVVETGPYSARIRFLAIEDRAVALFRAGHSFRSAYRVLSREGLAISYDAFRKNARKHLAARDLPGGRALDKETADTEPLAPDDGAPTRGPRSNPDRDRGRPRFHYDPANARREDLV